jgi:redox-sensitive bicupin YhaK (pirin superfamily)
MARAGAPGHEIVVIASHTDLEDVSGRVLFPTPRVGPFLPFVRFAETLATGRGDESGGHVHRREEVFNYIVEGRVEYTDDLDRRSVLEPGTVALLSAREEAHHNLTARPDPRARWLSVVAEVPATASGPAHRVQFAMPTPSVPPGGEVVERQLVGRRASVRSVAGLKCVAIEFVRDGRCVCPLGSGRRAVAYTYEGAATLDGGVVPAGSGALIDDRSELSVEARAGARVLLASVPRTTG